MREMGEGGWKLGYAWPPLLLPPVGGAPLLTAKSGSKSFPAGGSRRRWLPRPLPSGQSGACCSSGAAGGGPAAAGAAAAGAALVAAGVGRWLPAAATGAGRWLPAAAGLRLMLARAASRRGWAGTPGDSGPSSPGPEPVGLMGRLDCRLKELARLSACRQGRKRGWRVVGGGTGVAGRKCGQLQACAFVLGP